MPLTKHHSITCHVIILLFLTGLNLNAQSQNSRVLTAGAMRNVMMKGDLRSTIYLDTIKDNKNLYGIGPAESMTGELMIINGQSYVATATETQTIQVSNTNKTGAPFFVYARVNDWEEKTLPDSITNIKQFESYLDWILFNINQPVPFKLATRVAQSTIHVVNLPPGSVINSHEDTHQGEIKLTLYNELVDIVGFYSRKHKGTFTHHDSNVHMHLINKTRSSMGHLDQVSFKGSIKFFIPKNLL
jgi:acetolactate decarboxylase